LKEALNIYYCYDGMDLERNHWNTILDEKKYSEKVDAVITSSDYLKEKKQKINKHCFAVKNGVNFKMFEAHSKNNPYNSKRQKKIGYVGCLDYRFDIELMDFIIQSLPDVNFEFTGYLSNIEIPKRLEKYKNVKFIKSVKQHDVPQVLARYDAGIIPYNNLEINKGIYPLKVNEYLSLGLPVIMTDFAELSEFDSIVRISKTHEDFLKNIKIELEQDSIIKIKNRVQFAKNNSWEKRAEAFGDILEFVWKKKYGINSLANS
jgi:glycosyltransferase involved in cell wall biosynthesis